MKMKAKELSEMLIEAINQGIYQNKDKLPTEEQLMDIYAVSRYCIRQAMELLKEKGIVYQVQGSGIYVRENKRQDCLTLSNTQGISNEFSGYKVTTTLLSMEIVEADEALASQMECEVGTPIYVLERLRMVNGTPFAIEYTKYNKKIISYLNKEICEGSIYNYISEGLKLTIGFADKIIQARKLTKQEATYLQLEPNDPAIVFHDSVYLKNGELFNSSEVVYNYQKAKFFNLATYR